jgi:hypothetical protein
MADRLALSDLRVYRAKNNRSAIDFAVSVYQAVKKFFYLFSAQLKLFRPFA